MRVELEEQVPDGGWFEEYSCGCVSDVVRTKRELVGYCGKHGSNRRHVYPGTGVGAALAIDVGTAGSFVVNGGALGTPSQPAYDCREAIRRIVEVIDGVG